MFWKTSQNSQINTRSSHPEVFLSKDVLKNFAKFTDKHLCRSLLFNKVAGWKPETVRSSHWRCSVKKGVLKNFENFTGENLCWSLFLIKLKFWGLATLLKKTPMEVLSCEICKHFKNNYFEEHLWMPASKLYLKGDSNTGVFLWIVVSYSRTPILNFLKYLEKLFCITPPSNHSSHDVFFLFADQWGLQPKINLFGGAMIN